MLWDALSQRSPACRLHRHWYHLLRPDAGATSVAQHKAAKHRRILGAKIRNETLAG